MQINASNTTYLPSITQAYNMGAPKSTTLVYIRNCIDIWKEDLSSQLVV